MEHVGKQRRYMFTLFYNYQICILKEKKNSITILFSDRFCLPVTDHGNSTTFTGFIDVSQSLWSVACVQRHLISNHWLRLYRK